MMLALVSGIFPSEVYAAKEMPYSHGYIVFKYGTSDYAFVVDRDGKYKAKPPKGVSYNESTNTMTWNNVSLPYWDVEIQGMGDLTIELKGDNKVRKIMCWYGSGSQKITLTFSGNGKLTMNSKYQGNQVYGNIYVGGTNAKLTIGRDVAMDIKGTADNPPFKILKREATGPGNAGSYLSISGSHSSGALKWNGGIYEQYEWNKTTFTKTGSGSSSPPSGSGSSKTTVSEPAQVKNPKASLSGKNVTLSWKGLSKNCTGYQAQLSYNKNFKNAKVKKLSGKSKNKATWNSLTAGKTVYLRVRGYNTSNKTTKYGSFSKTVSVKVKSDSSGDSAYTSTSTKDTGSVKGLKAASPEKNKVTLTWTKVSQNCNGYLAQLSYSKDFSSVVQVINYDKNNNKALWTYINSNKYVYIRVRTITSNGTPENYGDWSSTVKIRVR
jgi:hypothetical protein